MAILLAKLTNGSYKSGSKNGSDCANNAHTIAHLAALTTAAHEQKRQQNNRQWQAKQQCN
jgi:hypothetical protein